MATTDAELMQEIKDRWGIQINESCVGTEISEAFLAALIANESGGDPDVQRFEPSVYERLKAKYPERTDPWCRANATSWGLTQIMGEDYDGVPSVLANPAVNLLTAVDLLEEFMHRFQLLPTEFERLFKCWNTGSPVGRTYDPNYVANGLARIAAYSPG